MVRLLQVDLHCLEAVALIGVIHGIAEVIERSTMVLIDHICHTVLENRTVPWGGFCTPRRERLAADITQPRPQGLLLVQYGGRRNPWPRLPSGSKSSLEFRHANMMKCLRFV